MLEDLADKALLGLLPNFVVSDWRLHILILGGTYEMVPKLRREAVWHGVEINGELSGFNQVIHY